MPKDLQEAASHGDRQTLRALWADDDRIRCIHPGSEALVGQDSVHASWARIFGATARIRFELVDLAVEVAGASAWVTCVEQIHALHGDEELVSEAVATNLFERTDAGWRLLLHHASPIARRFGG